MNDLLRQVLRVYKAEGVQGDFSYHGIIRHHHGHRSEQHLEIIRELLASSVAGVHRDYDVAGGVQTDFLTLEHEFLQIHAYGHLYGQDLLRDHRQDLQLDSIELVEAGPCPGPARGP